MNEDANARGLAPGPRPTRPRWRDWLARYGLAECAGISVALLASFAARHLTGNPIIAAYAGAWGETTGYLSAIAWRDVAANKIASADRASTTSRNIRGLVIDWLAEFGPSGILDTIVTRPLMMGMGARWFGPVRGLIFGKFAADVIFYIPVIFMYERRKSARAAEQLARTDGRLP